MSGRATTDGADHTEQLSPFDALAWRLRRAARGDALGAQRGRRRGAGSEFVDVVDLMLHPDPRRIDVRRTITDPAESVKARRFCPPSAVTVHVLVDWSGSLGGAAAADRRRMAETLTAGLARAALRAGDRFALTAARGEDPAPLTLAASRRPGLADWVRAALSALPPTGVGLARLIAAADAAPRKGAMIFVISDLEVSADELGALLAALDGKPAHMLWLLDSGFEAASNRPALTDVMDLETGRIETTLMRPWFAAAYARSRARRHAALMDVMTAHGRDPVRIMDSIDVTALAAAIGGEA
jgi:uncharacterized protein (DUF58 family)